MTEKLKKCPFCGGEAIEYKNILYVGIICMSCGAKIEKLRGIYVKDYIKESLDITEAWNRRAE